MVYENIKHLTLACYEHGKFDPSKPSEPLTQVVFPAIEKQGEGYSTYSLLPHIGSVNLGTIPEGVYDLILFPPTEDLNICAPVYVRQRYKHYGMALEVVWGAGGNVLTVQEIYDEIPSQFLYHQTLDFEPEEKSTEIDINVVDFTTEGFIWREDLTFPSEGLTVGEKTAIQYLAEDFFSNLVPTLNIECENGEEKVSLHNAIEKQKGKPIIILQDRNWKLMGGRL